MLLTFRSIATVGLSTQGLVDSAMAVDAQARAATAAIHRVVWFICLSVPAFILPSKTVDDRHIDGDFGAVQGMFHMKRAGQLDRFERRAIERIMAGTFMHLDVQ